MKQKPYVPADDIVAEPSMARRATLTKLILTFDLEAVLHSAVDSTNAIKSPVAKPVEYAAKVKLPPTLGAVGETKIPRTATLVPEMEAIFLHEASASDQ